MAIKDIKTVDIPRFNALALVTYLCRYLCRYTKWG